MSPRRAGSTATRLLIASETDLFRFDLATGARETSRRWRPTIPSPARTTGAPTPGAGSGSAPWARRPNRGPARSIATTGASCASSTPGSRSRTRSASRPMAASPISPIPPSRGLAQPLDPETAGRSGRAGGLARSPRGPQPRRRGGGRRGAVLGAQWGAGRVACYDPTAACGARPCPCRNPPARPSAARPSTLFVTTARQGMPTAHGRRAASGHDLRRRLCRPGPGGTPGDLVSLKRTLGVCYYPEHWPEEIWAEDAARMAEAGLTWVRIGEFAWSRLEPSPGRFRLRLARPRHRNAGRGRAEGRAGHAHRHAAALDARPSIPTCWPSTPRAPARLRLAPALLLQPRGLPDDAAASRRCWPTATANPHVAAWQTDNEYGCHDTTLLFRRRAPPSATGWRSATSRPTR
jgi:hypothetical protein